MAENEQDDSTYTEYHKKYYEETVKKDPVKLQKKRESSRKYWRENPEKYEEHKKKMRERARERREKLKRLEEQED